MFGTQVAASFLKMDANRHLRELDGTYDSLSKKAAEFYSNRKASLATTFGDAVVYVLKEEGALAKWLSVRTGQPAVPRKMEDLSRDEKADVTELLICEVCMTRGPTCVRTARSRAHARARTYAHRPARG